MQMMEDIYLQKMVGIITKQHFKLETRHIQDY